MPTFALTLLPNRLAICRLPADAAIPPWALAALNAGSFAAITRTHDELSVVCAQAHVPQVTRDDTSSDDSDTGALNSASAGAPGDGLRVDADWRAFRIEGPFAFTAVGVLAALASALAEAGVSLFAISTFDTDYLLVKADNTDSAIEALTTAGHVVETNEA